MRLLFWSILCCTLVTAGKLVAAGRPTRALTFRKGSSFFRGFKGLINVPQYPGGNPVPRVSAILLIETFGLTGTLKLYRVNYKTTILPSTTIFAYAAGFKLVWELPSGGGTASRRGRSIEDVHEAAELVYESHGFDGRSCLVKNVCQAMEYASKRDDVIAKILKLLAGNGVPSTEPLYCDVHVRNCPLQLTGIDGFADR